MVNDRMNNITDIETIVIEKVDAVYFKINCSIGQSMELKEFFSCYAPNYKWDIRFKSKIWSGKISYFDTRLKLLPIGLLPKLVKFCKQFNYNYRYEFNVDSMHNTLSQHDLNLFYNNIFKYVRDRYYPRDYQNDAIMNSIQNKRGITIAGTGSGKSLMFYTLTRFLRLMNKKILIIVPTVNLVEQAYNDFIDYGFTDISRETDKLYAKYSNEFNKDNIRPILISTYQSLISKPNSFFKIFDCVIVDECHGVRSESKSLQKILKLCSNAEYRYGFTGTMPLENADVFTLVGYIGPVIYDIGAKELIDKGILSQIKIANLILKYPLESVKECKGRGYDYELKYILNYKPRNKVLDFIINNTPSNQNTLILLSRIETHLKPVVDYLKVAFPNKRIRVIHGGVDAVERENVRSILEKENGIILVASYKTVSTGMNVKNLHQIVFFSSYKSRSTVLQSVGRGLRKHKSKDKLIVYDVVDDLGYQSKRNVVYNNHIYLHWLERLKFYKQQGFAFVNKHINI